MPKPLYGLFSDPHYHNWSAFSKTTPNGLNSRLQLQCDATYQMAQKVAESGCKYLFCAGDTFHTKGVISPTVLYYVTQTFKSIKADFGLQTVLIAGNHDLETDDSVFSANASASLEGVGVEIVCTKGVKTYDFGDTQVHLLSWRSKAAETLYDLKEFYQMIKDDGKQHDVIVHVGINKVLHGLPDTGLDPEELKAIGYRNVFAGHYHNHKVLVNGVTSIGALMHHNWGDVGSLAGFCIVNDDGTFQHYKTNSPEFMEADTATSEESLSGNYVRFKAIVDSLSEEEAIKNELMSFKPAGLICNFIQRSSLSKGTVTGISTAETSAIDSVDTSVASYCKLLHEEDPSFDLGSLTELCSVILAEAETKTV